MARSMPSTSRLCLLAVAVLLGNVLGSAVLYFLPFKPDENSTSGSSARQLARKTPAVYFGAVPLHGAADSLPRALNLPPDQLSLYRHAGTQELLGGAAVSTRSTSRARTDTVVIVCE